MQAGSAWLEVGFCWMDAHVVQSVQSHFLGITLFSVQMVELTVSALYAVLGPV